MEIPVERNILEINNEKAAELRKLFGKHKILVINMISSPGAGKTTLLEKTLVSLRNKFNIAVIEGDLQTDNDARRIEATGAKAVQINTHGGCHLNAKMIEDVLPNFDLENLDILVIENVGNLVCPVEFDCGENHQVAILSVTEGDDKPEKYPLLFSQSAAMLLNKIDLLPYVDFSVERAIGHARRLNDDLRVFEISCTKGTGLEAWYDWLCEARKAVL